MKDTSDKHITKETSDKHIEYSHKETEELLVALYNHCQMASQSIIQLNKYIDKDPLDKIMNGMTNTYNHYLSKVNSLCQSHHCQLASTTGWSQMMSNMSIRWQMLTDKCCAHAVKILVQGVFMGVIDINQSLNNSSNLQPDVIDLAKDLLEYNQQCINKLCRYL